jgi:hypothetical protein
VLGFTLGASVTQRGCRLSAGGRGLPRSRTSLFRPSQRQSRDGFLCGASPSSAGSPTRAAESRSLSFRARFWLGPFPAFLTEDSCLCLRERKHAQVLPTGFEPARYVRCEAHRSVPSDTGRPQSPKGDFAPWLQRLESPAHAGIVLCGCPLGGRFQPPSTCRPFSRREATWPLREGRTSTGRPDTQPLGSSHGYPPLRRTAGDVLRRSRT